MSVRKVRDALVVMVGFLALLWVLQVFNWADGYRLDTDFGILPHHVSRIPDIFLAPFLHFSWQHIEGNSVPLFVLGFLAAYRGIARFLLVTLIVGIISGVAVWLFQSSNELTVGASGLIFGYFGYVLLRGIFDRNVIDIVVGAIAGVLYWTILSVAIPGTPGISWIGHLGGLVGGVAAAWLLRTPPSARPAVGWGGFGDFGGLDGLRGKLGGRGSDAEDRGGAARESRGEA
ncbi:MAG TPA: rhomboid family intramembrane serine protease [Trebonia sp.]|nr:rhomboid family intramembrane serine protease [Trebonia sp.]